MEISKDGFRNYIYEKRFEYGSEVSIDGVVHPETYDKNSELIPALEDLSMFDITENTEQLARCIEHEGEIYQEIKDALYKWVDAAMETRKRQLVVEYQEASQKEPEHTDNEWEVEYEGSYQTNETIANKTYRMWFHVYKDWSYKNGEKVVRSWTVSYSVITNSVTRKQEVIASVDRKKFTSEEEFKKYIEGRKKAYSKYFKDIQPEIKKGYERAFMVNGMLLKGYKVEEE